MSTLNIAKNIDVAVKLIDSKKKELKEKKDARLRAETRIEENEKGLKKDYEEIESLGFEPEQLDAAIESMDKSLMEYNDKLVDLINKLEA